ncbi:SlyX family protein [Stutzerimonas urumqiensis]|uniref:SlyX family protein n=1 Tax=Stutzerimonas urumqiensis TaxID=638269 RepID=UPI003BAA997D
MGMSEDARFEALEIRLAFQEDTLQALNDVIVAQQQVIERLERQLLMLAKRQEDLSGQIAAADEEAPPPHY